MGRVKIKNRAAMHVDPFKWKKSRKSQAGRWFDLDLMLCFEEFACPKLVHNGLCFWLLLVSRPEEHVIVHF